MITLETIRNRAGILVAAFIGFALFAFILTDLLSSGQSIWRGSQNKVAVINGEEISIDQYQEKVNIMEEFTKLNQNSSSLGEEMMSQLRDRTWDDMIQEKLMASKYEDLGLTVTGVEVADMTYGKDIHPAIRQMFTNQETNQFEKERVLAFLKNKQQDQNASFFWVVFEQQLVKERNLNKYKALVKQGLYVTKSQAASEAKAKAAKVDFDFTSKTYASVADNSVSVSESEISDYYSKHKSDYKQAPQRAIEFVAFPIVPSAEDEKLAAEQINKIKAEFAANSGDAFQYAKLSSDGTVDETNYSLSQVPASLRSFASTASIGSVTGPYEENGVLKVTKLASIKQMPDSVKARHILLAASDPRAEAKADSLMSLIRRGSDFGVIARTNSTDRGSAANGGDLGWFKEGMMVKPFNDACFNNSKGSVVKVATQFGVHIIEVQEVGKPVAKYGLATIEKKVNYSSRTYQAIYGKATKFALENNSREKFVAAAKKENLQLTPVTGLTATSRVVSNLESPRELVRWAFNEAEVGEISPINELGNKFVIAILTGVSDDNYKSLADAKYEITQSLLKEKKAAKIIADLSGATKSATSLSSVAQQAGSTVQTATNINFGSYQVPGAGAEPAVVALAANSPVGKITAPVKGNNGVYVVKVNNISSTPENLDMEKSYLKQSNGYKVEYKAYESIKAAAEIEDNRGRFY